MCRLDIILWEVLNLLLWLDCVRYGNAYGCYYILLDGCSMRFLVKYIHPMQARQPGWHKEKTQQVHVYQPISTAYPVWGDSYIQTYSNLTLTREQKLVWAQSIHSVWQIMWAFYTIASLCVPGSGLGVILYFCFLKLCKTYEIPSHSAAFKWF